MVTHRKARGKKINIRVELFGFFEKKNIGELRDYCKDL